MEHWQPLMLLFILGPLLLNACNYEHVSITVDEKLPFSDCNSTNTSFYQCGSLHKMFDLLHHHTCCVDSKNTSIKVIIQQGNYALTSSHTLKNLCNIRFTSSANNLATIYCEPIVGVSSNFDTGVAFIAAKNLTIEHLTILECGMKHNSTSSENYNKGNFIVFHSALFIQNSTNVFLNNVNISNSNGVGLSLYDTNGIVNITNSFFIHNSLRNTKVSGEFGGGAIYIEFTNCTTGQALCDPHSNLYNSHAKYLVKNCAFQNNVAFSDAKDIADNLETGTFVNFGKGGALSLWLDGQAKNISVIVTSCSFDSNNAGLGGALMIQSRHNTTMNSIKISNCLFINNSATIQGGGGLAMGYITYQTGGEALYNNYSISHCTFKQNRALKNVGGGILVFLSREPNRSEPTNRFEIYNTIFEDNMAKYGSALQANKEYRDSIAIGIILTLVINNCTFIGNNINNSESHLSESEISDYGSIGAVASTEVDIAFKNNVVFVSNNFTALLMDRSTIEFTRNSSTVFCKNSGVQGGAIKLINGAWIKIHPNSYVMFDQNNALISGGAIHVNVRTPFDHLASHVCFIRYYKENIPPQNWMTNFTFRDNKVNVDTGKVLFANTLNPCHDPQVFKKLIGVDIENTSMPLSGINVDTKNLVSTSPRTFKFNNTYDGYIRVSPGKVFKLPIHLEDELNQSVNEVKFIASCIATSSPKVVSLYQITDGLIQIAGKPNETCLLHLQTDADYPVTTTVQINLLNCPPGFVFNENTTLCTCLVNSPNQNPVITGCHQTFFTAFIDPSYWIGYQSEDTLNLLYGSCPFQYCYPDNVSKDQILPQEANKTILNDYVCGSKNRTGVLCGRCIDGYSVGMNSATFACLKCDMPKPLFGVLILFATYIIPVSILFYAIMAFNIQMTTGPIGALLFYSQIVSSLYRFAFDYSHRDGNRAVLEVSNAAVALYSFSNLEFFSYDKFSTYCIFKNAGTVDILAFNLLLSFYPLLLVFIFFLLRRYCNCMCKSRFFHKYRFSRSITHGVSAFLVLCFAKLNVTAFAILISTDIFHIEEEKGKYQTVVYFQGDIEYFKEWPYILYALGALFTIVTVITIPTLILVLHPIIIKFAYYFGLGESGIIMIINKVLFIHKLKPILDSFQGHYKNNMRLFAGLQNFVYRIMFFYIAALPSQVKNQNFTLLMVGFLLCIIVLVHMLTMPFEQYKDNAVYSLVYTLMLAIVIIEYYLFSSSQRDRQYDIMLLWLEIVMLLLPLICVIVYCAYKLIPIINNLIRKYFCKFGNTDSGELDHYYYMSDFPERLLSNEGDDHGNGDDDINDDDDNKEETS